VFPSWIIEEANGFSDDHPELTKMWEDDCKENNTKPYKIFLVKEIHNGEIMMIFINFFSACGIAVQQHNHFVKCKKTKKITPKKEFISKNSLQKEDNS
jgi:hypothetical protein